MANFEENIRTALEKLAKALADASDLTVETRYKVIDPQNPNNLDNSTLAAKTVIRLDGDHEAVIPVLSNEAGGVAIDSGLLDLHVRNVQSAIEYRNKVLSALVDIIRKRGL